MWELSIVLLGTNGKKSIVSLALDAVDYTSATASAAVLVPALDAVTDAAISSTRLSEISAVTQTLPVAADVFEAASVSVHLLPVTELPKYGILNIPAPAIGIFEDTQGIGRDTVDKTAAPLTAFVEAVTAHATISDGEKPNATHGNSGIYAGRRIVRKAKLGTR